MNTQILEPGCYLDNHRGHYISRDMILLSQEYGFIVDSTDQWLLDSYEDHSHEENYPAQSIYELADSALEWLNGGPNEGVDRPIKGQNSPPIIPENHYWDWNDGDFGLYEIDQEDISIAENIARNLTHDFFKSQGVEDLLEDRIGRVIVSILCAICNNKKRRTDYE